MTKPTSQKLHKLAEQKIRVLEEALQTIKGRIEITNAENLYTVWRIADNSLNNAKEIGNGSTNDQPPEQPNDLPCKVLSERSIIDDLLTARGIKLVGEYFRDCNLLLDIIAEDQEKYKRLEQKRDELAAQVQSVIDAFVCGDHDDLEHVAGSLVDAARARAKEIGKLANR